MNGILSSWMRFVLASSFFLLLITTSVSCDDDPADGDDDVGDDDAADDDGGDDDGGDDDGGDDDTGDDDADDDCPPDCPPIESNGAWFHQEGEYVYLVGIDMQSLMAQGPDPEGWDPDWDGDYTRVLDELVAAGINKVRLWANNWFLGPDNVSQPFSRLESGLYDLDQWDDDYWTRLNDFALEALERGIFIEYCLFSQYQWDQYWQEAEENYWNADQNVNGAFTDNDGIEALYDEFFLNAPGQTTNSGHDLQYYQDALFDKAADEIGGYGNVFFMVFNEPRDFDVVYSWTHQVAANIHGAGYLSSVETEAGSDGVALPEYWDDPNVDILGWHVYDGDPHMISDALHNAHGRGRILQVSEGWDLRDPDTLAEVTREAWGWALSGGSYGFFHRDREFSTVGDQVWDDHVRVATTLRTVMESVRYWEMSPVDLAGAEHDGLVTQGPGSTGWQVLANPGSEYIVYFWGNSTSTPAVIDLEPGTYEARWIAAQDGAELLAVSLDGGPATSVDAPNPDHWDGDFGTVLVIGIEE